LARNFWTPEEDNRLRTAYLNRLLQQNLPCTAEIAKRKAARRRLFNSTLMIVDQATINAGFDFRR
jgi:hypothetical protein